MPVVALSETNVCRNRRWFYELGMDAGAIANDVLAMRIVIVGDIGSGKSSIVRSALRDPDVVGSEPEEDADGLRLQRFVYDYRGLKAVVELTEFPGDDRYLPLLPAFGAAAACVIFAVSLAEPDASRDLRNRVAALGGPPRCGIIVAGGGAVDPVMAATSNANVAEGAHVRLRALREMAADWSLHMVPVALGQTQILFKYCLNSRFLNRKVCAESLEQLELQRVLRTACGLVLRDVPENADPVHFLGSGASMVFGAPATQEV